MNKRPDFLFILADDMGSWAMRCAGNKDVITPNLDRLAENGMLFDNFFCASPVCSPARASIMTGMMPSAHGVHDWLRSGSLDRGALPDKPCFADERKPIRYLEGKTAFTDVLAENGYSCALSGKWHLGDSLSKQNGFSKWFTIGRGGCDYYHPDIIEDGTLKFCDRYITDLITEHAIDYLDNLASEEKPFFLSVNYTAPHSPWGEEQHPADVYNLYRDCTFTSTPDLPLHPDQLMSAPHGVGEERKRLLRGYYSAITAMDRGIGQIVDKLESLGRLENTIIIFSGDNGMNMGHHGIWGKGNGTFPLNLFDTSVKVPVIISWKNHIACKREGTILSHYDLFPTILELAGCNIPCSELRPGKSFAPLLLGGTYNSEDIIYVFDEYGSSRMIRTDEYKLIYRYPYGPHSLFDLINDPDEAKNLYGDPNYKEIQENLINRLFTWFNKYTDPAVDGTHEGVTGMGQIRKAGIYSEGKPVYSAFDSTCP